MLTKDEAQRIAGAVHILRPDWGTDGLMVILGDNRILFHPYRDVVVAFAALAADPTSRKPTRIFEQGHWWETAAPRPHERNTSAPIRRPADDDCDTCGLAADANHSDHTYTPRNSSGYGQPLTEPAREAMAEQMAATALDLTAAPCDECGQPPARHFAPAFADHDWRHA